MRWLKRTAFRYTGLCQVLLLTVSTAVSLATAPVARAADPPARPNIVLILADDLGYGDPGCYNPASRIPTPNIDRLAAQGMRFIDAHSPCTVCTPTRYGLLTGQMPFRVPRGGTVFTGAGGPSLIAADRLTLPQMLRDEGYHTACIGKWHVGLTFYDKAGQPIHQGGLEAVQRIDYSRRIDGGPLDCGFDEFFGTACCPTTDWLYAWIDGDRIPLPPTGQLDKTPLPKHPYANDNRPGMIASDFDLQEVDALLLEKSQAYLQRRVQEHPDQPFFLYHATQAVHLPSFPGRAFQGRTEFGPHGDFIFQLDYVVGQLMETLQQLGVAENTIVIFTSDNGPEVLPVYQMRKDYGHDGARPWRGIKRDNWEGGHRVPFIVRWPGQVPAGSESAQLLSLTDVMATVAAITDTELTANAAEDSFNLWPAWQDPAADPIREFVLVQGFRGARTLAIRQGNWKYLAHEGSGGNRYQDHRLLGQYYLPDSATGAPAQLYNLQSDPGETRNLYFEEPQRAADMARLLQTLREQGRSAPVRYGRERR
jgi:arylsulfatase A-like enzyme